MPEHHPECHQKSVKRENCYVCNVKDGARYVYDPNATCPACGARIPMSGHACPDLAAHTPALKVGPSGVRAECSCGWGGMPRYTDEQAYTDHAHHVEGDQ